MLAAPLGVSAQLWRALLSAGQQVSALVRAQIAADLIGAAVFAALVVWQGLAGAVTGFLASHLVLFLVQAWYVRRKLGAGLLRPRLGQFDWGVVRSNLGFGASGLLLIVLVNLGVLLVSQMLIGRLGPEANGYFANAWRIASVYLGAVTATTIGYFLPSLTRSPGQCCDGARGQRDAAVLSRGAAAGDGGDHGAGRMGGLADPEQQVRPRSPAAAAVGPGRTGADRRRYPARPAYGAAEAGPLTLDLSAAIRPVVGLAWLLVPLHGVAGAALAYAGATSGSLLLALLLVRAQFGFKLEAATLRLALLALGLLLAVGLLADYLPIALTRLGFCAIAGIVWLILALREDEPRRLLAVGLARLPRPS